MYLTNDRTNAEVRSNIVIVLNMKTNENIHSTASIARNCRVSQSIMNGNNAKYCQSFIFKPFKNLCSHSSPSINWHASNQAIFNQETSVMACFDENVWQAFMDLYYSGFCEWELDESKDEVSHISLLDLELVEQLPSLGITIKNLPALLCRGSLMVDRLEVGTFEGSRDGNVKPDPPQPDLGFESWCPSRFWEMPVRVTQKGRCPSGVRIRMEGQAQTQRVVAARARAGGLSVRDWVQDRYVANRLMVLGSSDDEDPRAPGRNSWFDDWVHIDVEDDFWWVEHSSPLASAQLIYAIIIM
ncbi:hypothetical protein H6P81_019650 [Aristolochia fimbriata]|uniref:Uncharacterized protein n=1 Tax=Aristolochia fimbriata TaxID=158543 RepID=A0AAV7DSC6_ARIFI|nr:hypothetical protein H6P81_019650 [Aristolochia fimbriata]